MSHSENFFTSLFPCLTGLGGLFIILTCGFPHLGLIVFPTEFSQAVDDFLCTSTFLTVAGGVLMIGGTIYAFYMGLMIFGNWKSIIGDPEDHVTTYSVKDVYDNIEVTSSSSDEYSSVQILLFIFMLIIGYLIILAFGWLIYIIRTIRIAL